MKKVWEILFLMVIVSSAMMGGYMFVSRFLHLTNGFQYDELYSIATATPSVSWSVVWHEMLLCDVNLPLFNILFRGWNYIFPISPVYSHLFSALLGALAVVASVLLAPKNWPKLKTFILTVLMSGSFILTAYGTNVRAYSLSVLLATCFTLIALRFIEHFEQARAIPAKQWICFFLIGFLGSYSHYFCAVSFFIAALVLFLYACYYRQGRAWSFFGTAVVFFLWLPWVIHALSLMGGIVPGAEGAGDWWYQSPVILATWEVLIFLFGPAWILYGLLVLAVAGGVSLKGSYGKKIFQLADIILPLAQIVLLCGVLTVVGVRFNLWMDRYFLPFLPSVFILLTSVLYHLYSRHKLFIVLLPVLLFGWLHTYWNMEYIWAREYTGLQDAFTYLTRRGGPEKVLVDRSHMGYSAKALDVMLDYYVPKDSKLQLITLNEENKSLVWTSQPRIPVLMMLCSQVDLMKTIVWLHIDEKSLKTFGRDTCVVKSTVFQEPVKNSK